MKQALLCRHCSKVRYVPVHPRAKLVPIVRYKTCPACWAVMFPPPVKNESHTEARQGPPADVRGELDRSLSLLRDLLWRTRP